MNAHKNARTTVHIRELMAARFAAGWTAGEIAEAVGISVRTVYKWLARHRRGGVGALADAASAPGRVANRLADPVIAEIARLRRERRLTGAAIARRLRLRRSTVAGWLARLGIGRLRLLQDKPPAVRYERERAGELVHVDVKKLGRFNKIGHRITGDPQAGKSRRAGWDFVHVAIDDATRLAYVEILPDEKKESATAFLERALRWLKRQGVRVERVMSDNGSCYKSHLFGDLCRARGIKHIRTRPYTPKTNGKAERFIQTLLREWAYARPYQTSRRRNLALASFVDRYNHRRPHASLAGRSPAYALSVRR
ncbi:MAG TPA: IS481 family transposase [Caulobacterales bacterium]|nr:IS481 family transposase [Caulobacterales bacterium]